MTEIAQSNAGVSAPRTRDRIIVAVIVVVGGTLMVLMNGGRPRSLWFYPFIAALAILVLFYRPGTYRAGWLKGELGPVQPVGTALRRGVTRGVFAGALMYAIFELGSPMPTDFLVAAMFAFWTGSDEYLYRRGLKHTYWTVFAAFGGMLVIEILLLRFNVIH